MVSLHSNYAHASQSLNETIYLLMYNFFHSYRRHSTNQYFLSIDDDIFFGILVNFLALVFTFGVTSYPSILVLYMKGSVEKGR